MMIVMGMRMVVVVAYTHIVVHTCMRTDMQRGNHVHRDIDIQTLPVATVVVIVVVVVIFAFL